VLGSREREGRKEGDGGKREKRKGRKEKENEEKENGEKGKEGKEKGGGRCAPAATAAAVGHAWRAGRGRWGTRSEGREEKGERAGFAAAGHDASRWMGKRWDVN